MTDWNEEYYRDTSFAKQLAHDILIGQSNPMAPSPESCILVEAVAVMIRNRLVEELEPIVEQIEEYPISEDEIKRMGAEIRSLYED